MCAEQKIIHPEEYRQGLEKWLTDAARRGPVMFVHGSTLKRLDTFRQMLDKITMEHGIKLIPFSDYQANPRYESVEKGAALFNANHCGAIMAVGGGSAIDVAKCIKLFSNMDPAKNYLEQTIVPNDIPFLVMPTTSGTGSEATRYAVIYYNGVKQSVTHASCIPDTVIFDPAALKTLPAYQKKATMMDAFCHALESFWSVNSTEESRGYSRDAIRLVLENMDAYLENREEGNEKMLLASYIAGKAINITQTTAGHAMCYKITSLFGTAHGHSAALCDRVLFPRMISDMDHCIDPRGEEYLQGVLEEIAHAMGCSNAEKAAKRFNAIFDSLELPVPEATAEQFAELRTSVNPIRLKNHPVALDEETIDSLYHQILKEKAS